MKHCAACGYHQIVRRVMDIPHSFMGKKTVIPAVGCHVCEECGEIFFGPEAARVVEEGMKRFDSEVAAGFGISPQFIRQVRKKLNLGQKEAGSLFGGGVNAFSRYETGKTPPPVALVKLLKLLDRHPDLLHELRGSAPG